MGDRVSISFVSYNRDGTVFDESVALFSHWGGPEFAERASSFIKNGTMFDEPGFVMVEFIKSLPEKDIDAYLGKDSRDGDNSDNGHFRIDIKDGSIKSYTPYTQKEEDEIIKNQNSALRGVIVRSANELGTIKMDLDKIKRELESKIKE